MAYAPRIQHSPHPLTFSCYCGAISMHHVAPQTYKLRCPTCRRVVVLGNTVMDVTSEPGRAKPPADLSIPRDSAGVPIPYCETLQDAGANGPCEEQTVRAGVWRSSEPVTLDMPRELPDLWRDKLTGVIYHACSLGLATRYIVQQVGAQDDTRQLVGGKEWSARCERLSRGPR